jgi:hypothetical protein
MRTTTELGRNFKTELLGLSKILLNSERKVCWGNEISLRTKSSVLKANFVNEVPRLNKLKKAVLLLPDTKLHIELYCYFEVCRDVLLY